MLRGCKGGLARIADQLQEHAAKQGNILRFLEALGQSELLTDLDEALWHGNSDCPI